MRSSRFFGFCLVASLAAPTFAETRTDEFAGTWFLNPVTANWACSLSQTGYTIDLSKFKCAPDSPAYNAFVYAQPFTWTEGGVSKYFFLVQEWGQIGSWHPTTGVLQSAQGPGGECWGDSILLFSAPFTAQGARGTGITYRGVINPCPTTPGTRGLWSFHSVFTRNGKIYVTAQKAAENCDTAGCFSEIWLGESTTGFTWTWTKIASVDKVAQPRLDVLGVFVTKDANNNVFGYLSFDDFDDPYWHTAGPVRLDVTTRSLSYQTASLSWVTVPTGGFITQKPRLQFASGVTAFTNVGNRFELWLAGNLLDADNNGVVDSAPDGCDGGTLPDGRSELPPRSCTPPPGCTDLATYNANANNPAFQNGTTVRWTHGGAANYVVVDANFNVLQPYRLLSSTQFTSPIPADYGWEFAGLTHVDTLAGSTLYYGSQRATICANRLLDYPFYWSGSGIRFGRVQIVP